MGGSLSLRLAETHPGEISGMVLVNAAIATNDRRLVVLPVLKHLVKTFPGVANDIKKPGVTEVAYDRMPLKAVASMIDGWKTVRADLDMVDCPVLHFHSREDHVVDPSSSVFLKRGVPDLKEVILEDSYHVATLDNDAPRVFEGSLDFVRTNSRAVSG